QDDDGDGVPDDYDDYPIDPERAFDVHYYGTLAYEDLWPAKGDYDFNDLIIEYDFWTVQNADSHIKDFKPTFSCKATGAGFNNGFAIEFPINTANIANFTSADGSILETNLLATVMLFDNAHTEFGLSGFVNTEVGGTTASPFDVSFEMTLTNPLNPNTATWTLPYNPFIFTNNYGYLDNNGRPLEIHLLDMPPTEIGITTLWGTEDDASIPGSGIYYKTSNNLPWGLHIPTTGWLWPVEKAPILKGYLFFKTWAESGGTIHQDWYLDVPGNLDPTYLYQ
ncbi:MAG: LruC domain-containing protein, partial [Candidatus Cloacimonetes bacterium]|nr:LruC domain-containing protein [Candidatus Cloacimonadota bacterium]